MNRRIAILGSNQPRKLSLVDRPNYVIVDPQEQCDELSVADEFNVLPKVEKTRSELMHGKEKRQKKHRNRNDKAFRNRLKKRRSKKKANKSKHT